MIYTVFWRVKTRGKNLRDIAISLVYYPEVSSQSRSCSRWIESGSRTKDPVRVTRLREGLAATGSCEIPRHGERERRTNASRACKCRLVCTKEVSVSHVASRGFDKNGFSFWQ